MLIFTLVAFAAAARLYDLRADPPAYFSGGSQDLTTDGAYLTLHARSTALTGEWDPFGYQHWEEFKISLISGLSYVIFRLAGSSLFTMNLTGVILSVAALLLFVIALSRHCTPRSLVFIAFFLAADYLLWLFGRLPFAENAVLFFASAIFFVFTFWFERAWGKVLIGILVASCGLFGKSFGFLILAGPLMYIAVDRESRDWRTLLAIFAPIVVGLYLYAVLVSGKASLLSFIWQHATGDHGYPYGLLSPVNYFEKLITFANNGLFTFAPVPGILAWLILTRTLLSPHEVHSPQRKVVPFMAGWLAIWLILISPFNYLPVRYLFILLVPICVLAGLGLDRLSESIPGLAGRLAWWRWVGLILLNWVFMYYVAVYPVITLKSDYGVLHWSWLALPLGLVLLALEWWVLKRGDLRIPLIAQRSVTALAVIATLTVNFRQFYDWYATRTYAIYEAATDMSKILGPSAVLAGQYGPALASESRLRSFPLFVSPDQRSFVPLLSRYPITHLAVSQTDWDRFAKGDDELMACPIVARYWLRDKVVYVARINSLFGNPDAIRYAESGYETAMDLCDAGKGDSCYSYLKRFRRANPTSQSAMLEDYHMTVNPEDLMSSRAILDSLVSAWPTDMTVQVTGSVFYRALYERTGLPTYQRLAQEHMNAALRYSPRNERAIRDACKNAQPEQRIF